MNKTKKSVKSLLALVCVVALVVGTLGALAACGKKQSITFEESELTMYIADVERLEYVVTPDDAEITWESSNTKVATVNKRGAVTGVAKGTAVITATLESGASATCQITVLDRTVTISQTTAEVDLSQTNELTLTASSSDNGQITWTSSDTSVATVNNGKVTFGKAIAQTATVTITAQRGAARATCVITVTDPRIPEDYYLLSKETNANVVAHPGVWYYHADGAESTNYKFDDAPAFGGGKLTADLSIFPNLDDGKYFRFRYQPEMEVGTKYTLKFTVKVNVNCAIGYGTSSAGGGVNTQSVTANVAKQMIFIGTVNTAEPFHININKLNLAADEELGNVTFEISNITIKEYEDGDEDDITIDIPDTPLPDEYDLVRGTTGETCTNAGKWYYMIDPTNAGETDFSQANYDHGTITLALNAGLSGQYHQLRVQPRYQLNTRVEATFTVSVTAPSKITFGRNGNSGARTAVVFGTELTEEDEANGVQLYNVGEEVTLKKVFVVTNNDPFVIAIVPDNIGNACTMVVKDVTFAEKPLQDLTVTFDVNGGNALSATDATAKVKEGEAIKSLPTPTRDGGYTFLGWFDNAECDGTAVVAPYTPESSMTLYAGWADPATQTFVVSFETNGGTAATSQTVTGGQSVTLPSTTRAGYVFDGWYEDESFGGSKLDGATYTPSATITLYAKWLKEHTVTLNRNNYNSSGNVSETKKVVDGSSVALTAPTRYGYDFGGWFDNAECEGTAVNADSYAPDSDVTLYAKWTVQSSYALKDGGYGDVANNRETWYYKLHGTQSSGKVNSATYDNGTVTLDVSGAKTLANTAKSDNLVQLRFLANVATGEYFTITFNYTASVNGKVWIGRNDVGDWYDVTANTPVELTYTTKAEINSSDNQFRVLLVGFYPTEDNQNVTITATDIVCGETVKPAPPATYTLENKTNGEVCSNPGVWYCNYPGSSTAPGVACDTANTKYDNGVVTFAFTNIVNADGSNGYQLRYQPDFAVGTQYTITFKFKISVAGGRVLYSSEYKNSNDSHGGQPMDADEELQITYTGTVKDGAPFMIQLKGVSDGAVTLTVWDIVVTAA